MEPFSQYFHMVLFISYVVLTFESVKEILWWDHSNETSLTVLSHCSTCFVHNSNFGSVEEMLWCDHSKKTSLAVLSHGSICLFFSINFCKMKSASFLNFDFVFYTWGHRVKGARDKVQLVCNPHVHNALPQAITTLKFKAYNTSIYKPHYEIEIPHVYMIRKHWL